MAGKRNDGMTEDCRAMRLTVFLYPNGTVTDAHLAQ